MPNENADAYASSITNSDDGNGENAGNNLPTAAEINDPILHGSMGFMGTHESVSLSSNKPGKLMINTTGFLRSGAGTASNAPSKEEVLEDFNYLIYSPFLNKSEIEWINCRKEELMKPNNKELDNPLIRTQLQSAINSSLQNIENEKERRSKRLEELKKDANIPGLLPKFYTKRIKEIVSKNKKASKSHLPDLSYINEILALRLLTEANLQQPVRENRYVRKWRKQWKASQEEIEGGIARTNTQVSAATSATDTTAGNNVSASRKTTTSLSEELSQIADDWEMAYKQNLEKEARIAFDEEYRLKAIGFFKAVWAKISNKEAKEAKEAFRTAALDHYKATQLSNAIADSDRQIITYNGKLTEIESATRWLVERKGTLENNKANNDMKTVPAWWNISQRPSRRQTQHEKTVIERDLMAVERMLTALETLKQTVEADKAFEEKKKKLLTQRRQQLNVSNRSRIGSNVNNGPGIEVRDFERELNKAKDKVNNNNLLITFTTKDWKGFEKKLQELEVRQTINNLKRESHKAFYTLYQFRGTLNPVSLWQWREFKKRSRLNFEQHKIADMKTTLKELKGQIDEKINALNSQKENIRDSRNALRKWVFPTDEAQRIQKSLKKLNAINREVQEQWKSLNWENGTRLRSIWRDTTASDENKRIDREKALKKKRVLREEKTNGTIQKSDFESPVEINNGNTKMPSVLNITRKIDKFSQYFSRKHSDVENLPIKTFKALNPLTKVTRRSTGNDSFISKISSNVSV